MNFILFITFLLTACKGGLWIGLGVLIRNHFDAILSMLLRKPIPENLIAETDKEKIDKVIRIIGLLIIGIGVGTVIIALSTLFAGSRMTNNFHLNF
ncbi:MAG: hypothetical protein N4A71_09875 [Carboxylicivirga sp.]|jgi:hypothetical protein|nr:hypothetical protein [Carboxylicivirga sp.]